MSVRVNSFLRSLKVEIREVMEVATSDMIDIVTVLLWAEPYFSEQADASVCFLLSIQ